MHTHCNTLQHTPASSNHAATHCTALHRNALHCFATHCNKPVRCCLVRRRGKRSSQYVQFIRAVWHDSFHVCAVTRLCVPWLVCVCYLRPNLCNLWVLLSICTSHVTRTNESCHTYEWVMSHVRMSHVTRTNESCHTHVRFQCVTIMSHKSACHNMCNILRVLCDMTHFMCVTRLIRDSFVTHSS